MSNDRLEGWEEIARFLGFSVRKAQRLGKELKAAGFLFVTVKRVRKADGTLKKIAQKVVFTFESDLKLWLILKSGKNEKV